MHANSVRSCLSAQFLGLALCSLARTARQVTPVEAGTLAEDMCKLPYGKARSLFAGLALAAVAALTQNTRLLHAGHNLQADFCGDPGGPLAAIGSEPRQARKGATVITNSCAGVWLSGLPPSPSHTSICR